VGTITEVMQSVEPVSGASTESAIARAARFG
jgi:hypothetical protein